MSLTIGMRMAKKAFFDRDKVEGAMDKATRRVYSRFGAYTRTNARDRLRRRKSSAGPGESPNVHTSPGLRNIYFYYDEAKQTVVIGPIKFNTNPYTNRTVPNVLEFGGIAITKDGERRDYDEHPFMSPAFNETLKDLMAMWKNELQ